MALTVENYLKLKTGSRKTKKTWLSYVDHIKYVNPRGQSREHFLNRLITGYQKKLELDKEFQIQFTNTETGESRWITPADSARFTKKYRDRTYYKLALMEHLNAVGFLTLTVPAPADNKPDWNDHAYDLKIREFSNKWQRLRSYAWRYGVKFDYFRVFEVTKKGLLHCHVIIFSESYKISIFELELLAQYWHDKHGFAKLIRWQREGNLEFTYEYFINNNSPNQWRQKLDKNHVPVQYKLDPNKNNRSALNYVMKYQLKEQTLLGKAIMTKYRIRSYSYSQSISWCIRKIISSGKIELTGKKFGAIDRGEIDRKLKNDVSSEKQNFRNIPDLQDPFKILRDCTFIYWKITKLSDPEKWELTFR